MTQSNKHTSFLLQEEEQLFQNHNPIETIINNIKKYSQENSNLLQKYNEQFYLNYFDRNRIQHIILKLGNEENLKKELLLEQFMRLFLGFMEHNENETLFLAMSLRNLFIKIKQNTNNENGVKFTDFTNYLCDKIATDNYDILVPLKKVPAEKIVPDVSRVRQIDINPPIVLMSKQSDQPRIAKQKKKIDKKLKQRKPVSKFIFNHVNQQIITMGRLSSTIHFYDMELKKLPLDIIPKTFKDTSRQIAILSMDFDQAHQRIGAIINGIGLSFWELADNLQTQKTINKFYGQKILYLKLFKEWITADKNTIYFWNIKEQTISRKITNQQSHIINAVCQINHLRCLCVSYSNLDQKKPIIFYKDYKPIARYDMGSHGCHTLHYNVPSQLIIAAGYHNQLEVLQLQNNTYSINLIKQLKGHRSIVTCVADVQSTNFILSGDDLGQVRIWELNSMKCIQVVQVAKSITQMYCTGDKLIFSDSRLNIMQMDNFTTNSNNDEQIIQHFFHQQIDSQFIITRKSIRKLNLHSGKVQKILIVCDQQEQISSAIYITSGIIIGTSKGFIKLFSFQGQIKWELNAHQAQITQLQYDRKTRFIFSLAADNKLIIWPEKSIIQDGPKKIITFKNKNFNILTLFNQLRLLFLASTEENQVCVWDFQNLKLLTIIKLNFPVIFMDVNQIYKILLISTINDEFYFFKLSQKNGNLNYQLIYNGDSTLSGLKNSIKVENSTQNNLISCEKIDDKQQKNTKKSTIIQQIENEKIPTSKQQTVKENIQHKISRGKNTCKINGKNIGFQEKQQVINTVPSIKLIKQSKNQLSHEEGQTKLGTLKTLKKIQNEITTRIQIKQTDHAIFLVVGTSKGRISCYNISELIKQKFINLETTFKKNDSPQLYRQAKQDYDTQLSKQKYEQLSCQNIPKMNKLKRSYFRRMWRQFCLSREPISCMSFIQMKNLYVCVSMTDGCCKYFDLQNGVIKGNIRVSLPLPILWEIEVERDSYIKKNLYQTLIVLNNILTNHGFEMLSKQYKAINVTGFLQTLKRKTLKSSTSIKRFQQAQSKKTKAVKLLQDQYSVEDLRKDRSPPGSKSVNIDGQSTLKSLQVYKRVKQIKQQMLQDVKQKQLAEKNNQDWKQRMTAQVLRQKQDIEKLLKPNYFSIVGQFGVTSNMSKSMELGSLDERSMILLDRVKQNKKKLNSQHISNNQVDKKRLSKESFTLPTIQHSKTHSSENHLGDNLVKQNSLVNKLANSLSSSLLPKNSKLQSSGQFSNSFMGSSLMKSSSAASLFSNTGHLATVTNPIRVSELHKKPYLKLNESKQNELKLKEDEIKKGLEDKSTRQILTQINQKLMKYKKSSYHKRDSIPSKE